MAAMVCPKCGTDMVLVTKRKSLTVSGAVGALLFIVGAILVAWGVYDWQLAKEILAALGVYGWPLPISKLILGCGLMVLGILFGAMSSRIQTFMKCPSCQHTGMPL